MARTETLEILSGVIDSLDALDEAQSGAPLRSADWNVVVAAVTDLAKLVSSRETSLKDQLTSGFAPIGHEHRGEATLTWFDPSTRRLLETATTGSADLRVGMTRMDKNITGLRAEIKELHGELDALRLSFEELRDADFARERSIGKVANDVETLRDLETGVDSLSERLTGLDSSITAVLGFRDDLEANAGTVDIGGLQDRVVELEGMRENLITADGELVEIRAIESQLARLEEDVISPTEIDGLIAERVSDAALLEDAGLLAGISSQIEASLDPRISTIEGDVTRLGNDLGGLEARVAPVDERLDAIEVSVKENQESLAAVSPRLDTAETDLKTLSAGLEETGSALSQLDTLSSSVADLDARVGGLNATVKLAATNAAAIEELSGRTRTIETDLSEVVGLTGRVVVLENEMESVGRIDTKLGQLEIQTGGFEERLELTEAELATLEGSTDRIAELESQNRSIAQWQVNTDKRIDQLSSGARTALDERVSVLEQGFADQAATLTSLNTKMEPLLLRSPTGRVTDVIVR